MSLSVDLGCLLSRFLISGTIKGQLSWRDRVIAVVLGQPGVVGDLIVGRIYLPRSTTNKVMNQMLLITLLFFVFMTRQQ